VERLLTVCALDGGMVATFVSAFSGAVLIEVSRVSGVTGRDRLKNQSELDVDLFDIMLLEELRAERGVGTKGRRLVILFVAVLPLDDGRLDDVFGRKLLSTFCTPVLVEAGRIGLGDCGGERY